MSSDRNAAGEIGSKEGMIDGLLKLFNKNLYPFPTVPYRYRLYLEVKGWHRKVFRGCGYLWRDNSRELPWLLYWTVMISELFLAYASQFSPDMRFASGWDAVYASSFRLSDAELRAIRGAYARHFWAGEKCQIWHIYLLDMRVIMPDTRVISCTYNTDDRSSFLGR